MSVNGYRVTISENWHLYRVPDLLVRLCINFESNPMLSLYRPLSRPDPRYIPLERKCVREDPSVGGNVKNRIAHRIHNVTAYVWVVSDTFSLQWDIQDNFSNKNNYFLNS